MHNAAKEKDETHSVVLGTQEENSVSVQLKKIADHLVFLERKLDLLLKQPRESKSFGHGSGNKYFQRPWENQRPGRRPDHRASGFAARHHGSQPPASRRRPHAHPGHSHSH